MEARRAVHDNNLPEKVSEESARENKDTSSKIELPSLDTQEFGPLLVLLRNSVFPAEELRIENQKKLFEVCFQKSLEELDPLRTSPREFLASFEEFNDLPGRTVLNRIECEVSNTQDFNLKVFLASARLIGESPWEVFERNVVGSFEDASPWIFALSQASIPDKNRFFKTEVFHVSDLSEGDLKRLARACIQAVDPTRVIDRLLDNLQERRERHLNGEGGLFDEDNCRYLVHLIREVLESTREPRNPYYHQTDWALDQGTLRRFYSLSNPFAPEESISLIESVRDVDALTIYTASVKAAVLSEKDFRSRKQALSSIEGLKKFGWFTVSDLRGRFLEFLDTNSGLDPRVQGEVVRRLLSPPISGREGARSLRDSIINSVEVGEAPKSLGILCLLAKKIEKVGPKSFEARAKNVLHEVFSYKFKDEDYLPRAIVSLSKETLCSVTGEPSKRKVGAELVRYPVVSLLSKIGWQTLINWAASPDNLVLRSNTQRVLLAGVNASSNRELESMRSQLTKHRSNPLLRILAGLPDQEIL